MALAHHVRSLFELGNFIGNQSIAKPMDGDGGFFIGYFNEAKDHVARLVEPVAQVPDAVLLLDLQVGCMGLGERISDQPFDMVVHIHRQWPVVSRSAAGVLWTPHPHVGSGLQNS